MNSNAIHKPRVGTFSNKQRDFTMMSDEWSKFFFLIFIIICYYILFMSFEVIKI